jgi:hypothetical protein
VLASFLVFDTYAKFYQDCTVPRKCMWLLHVQGQGEEVPIVTGSGWFDSDVPSESIT